MNVLSKIAFGGLMEFNSNNVELRSVQINDNFRIHTDYFYNQSLKVINKASRNTKKIPKVTAKIHINNIYENKISRFNQISRIVDLLGFVPKDFHISIVGNYSYRDFLNENYDAFLKKINQNFGIKKVFIETFPSNERNIIKIINSKKCFGCSYPENFFHTSFLNKYFKTVNYFSYSILGNPNWIINYFSKKQKDYINYLYKNTGKTMIDLNLDYLIKKIKNDNYHQYGITSCKNIPQYKDLLKKINLKMKKKHNKIVSYPSFHSTTYYSFPDKMISLSPYIIFKNIRDYRYTLKLFIIFIKIITRIENLNKKWI
jgi:hypothetical protein